LWLIFNVGQFVQMQVQLLSEGKLQHHSVMTEESKAATLQSHKPFNSVKNLHNLFYK